MLIVHRCTVCNHPDVWAASGTTACPHRAGIPTPQTVRRRHCAGSAATVRNGGSCHGSGDGACTWSKPTTMREWRFDGSENTEIREPGTATGTHRTCDGDDCRKLYTEMTGRSPW